MFLKGIVFLYPFCFLYICKNNTIMRRIEVIFLIIIFIGVVLSFIGIPGGSALFILTGLIFSLIYFIFSVFLMNDGTIKTMFKKGFLSEKSTIEIVLPIFTGFVLSITIISILFRFSFWPSSKRIFFTGFLPLLPILIFSVIKFLNDKNDFFKKMIIRLSIIGSIVFVIYLIPETKLFEIKYRQYPDYIEAFKYLRENPGDFEAIERFNTEEEKMWHQRKN